MQEQYALLKYYQQKLEDKEAMKLNFNVLERIMNKTESFEDALVEEKVSLVLNELKHDNEHTKKKYKTYFEEFNGLKDYIMTKYGYVQKGSIQSQYMGLGVVLGSAIGVSFVCINPAFIGVGIPFGIVIGSSIGASKEKELEKQGKLY